MVNQHQQFDLFDKKIFERVVLTPPMKIPGQMPNEACFYYVVEGATEFNGVYGELCLGAEEAVVLKCGQYLSRWIESSDYSTCVIVAVHFYPEVLRKLYDKELPQFLSNVGKIMPVTFQKSKADKLIKSYIEGLQFYFENTELVSDELLKLKLKELILLLAKTDNADTIASLIAGLFNPEEHSLKEIIEANIFSKITVEELAMLCGKSVSTFKREFTKIYAESPASYIRKVRLKRAAELLKKTQKRINEIAFDCGFQEVAHFSNAFRKQYNLSPSDYRLN